MMAYPAGCVCIIYYSALFRLVDQSSTWHYFLTLLPHFLMCGLALTFDFANIISLSVSLSHGKRHAHCKEGRRCWILCRFCRLVCLISHFKVIGTLLQYLQGHNSMPKIFEGASFMFGRALTSVLWGAISDRYGRKPVIMIGTVSAVVFSTLFGLSRSFWMAITTRFLLGMMNGLFGTITAYASEVCRAEHQALGLSLVSTAWGIGLIIGPAIGGFLAQPAEKYPDIISKDSLFGRFPYFLPCLCISIIAAVVFIACFWLPETLHMNHENNFEEDGPYEALEASSDGCGMKGNIPENGIRHPESKKSLLKNWPLMSSIIVYCVFSLHDMAYSEIFSLWAVSPKKFGGLSFSTDDVGVVLSISGVGLLIFQSLLYPMVERVLGFIVVARIAAALSVPLLQSYPFIAMLSGVRLSMILNSASMFMNIFSISVITGLVILQNNAVEQDQRGAANGIAMTGMSLFKAFGPAMGGVLFSWAQKRQDAFFLPGSHMIFFVLNVIQVIALIMTFKPFLSIPAR